MRQQILRKRVNDIINEIIRDHKLIKEIDFNTDISKNESGKYVINTSNNYLQFLFQGKEVMTPNDYTTIFGDVDTYENSLIMIPTFNDKFGDSSYASVSLLIKKMFIQPKVDIIYLKFSKSKESYFYFRPSNLIFQEIMSNLKNCEIKNSLSRLRIHDCKTIDCMFSNDSLIIAKRNGLELDKNTSVKLPLNNNTIEFIINKKRGYIIIENEKINISFLRTIREEKMCIGLLAFTQNVSNLRETLSIESIVYGSESGYVYLNKLKIESKIIQIIMVNTGNSIIQYFSVELNSWQDAEKNQDIHIDSNIRIRINMSTGDKVYRILIIEKDK